MIDFKGDIITDTSKPDGMPKKLLDVSLLAKLGWEYKTNIREGLEKTYEWFLENQDSLRSKENFSSSKITKKKSLSFDLYIALNKLIIL